MDLENVDVPEKLYRNDPSHKFTLMLHLNVLTWYRPKIVDGVKTHF